MTKTPTAKKLAKKTPTAALKTRGVSRRDKTISPPDQSKRSRFRLT